eukprot:CAMPEP_0194200194 /NCGR_PEP_ID=MMETSP0156-20130528/905_1 /TAXON_ID=33649 /ORGANISM="Thalassionema nitzschioides, Strain L26-B" /LENGTH=1201 /DNA_ID=CAMNT_0038925161 /DNA_START=53 /DNA_END=3658 /DNA_ORIENTATION=+
MFRLSSKTLVGLLLSVWAVEVHSLGCTFDLQEALPVDPTSPIPHAYVCEFFDGSFHEFILTPEQRGKVDFLINDGTITPGVTVFHNNAATRTDHGIVIPPQMVNIFQPSAVFSGDDFMPARRELVNPNRRLSTLSGDSHYLVVKVHDVNGLAHAHNLTTISDNIFGNEGDLVNLKSQVTDCTAGALNVVAGYPASASQAEKDAVDAKTVDLGSPVGVMDVHLSFDMTNSSEYGGTRSEFASKVTTATGELLGFTLPGPFENIIFVLEDCYTEPCGWAAFAGVNSWYQFYKKDYYRDPAVLLHEYGHNLGFAHSGKINDSEYSDHTCIMGNPLYGDDNGKMCFNPAKSYQSGWYTNKGGGGIVEFDPSVSTSWSGTLMGVGEWKDVGDIAPHPVVVKIESGTDTDFFVGFNRAAGANSQNDEADDKVTIIQTGSDGTSYSQSYRIWDGVAGQSYIWSNWQGTGMDLIVQVTNIDISSAPGTASINIALSGTSFPTPVPTCSPVFSAYSVCPLGPFDLDAGFCSNNSCAVMRGLFFDVTAKTNDILITALNYYSSLAGSDIEIWTMTSSGSHAGNQANQGLWTKVADHISLTGFDFTEDSAPFDTGVTVTAGTTQGFLIISVNEDAGVAASNTGTALGAINIEDDYLQIKNGQMTSSYWPSGLTYYSYPLAGRFEYAVLQSSAAGSVTPVPAPATPVPAPATPVPDPVTPVPAPATPAPGPVTPVPAPAPGPGSRARITVTGTIHLSNCPNVEQFLELIKAAIAAFLNISVEDITLTVISGGANRERLLQSGRRLQTDDATIQVTIDTTQECTDETCEASAQSTSSEIETNLGNTSGVTTSIQQTGTENGETTLQNTAVDSADGISSNVQIENTGGANGDPVILGLQNQVFKFDGRDGAWYSNLASKDLQWNMLFKTFETCPADENTFISGISLSTSDETSKGLSSDILIVTTPEPIPECQNDPNNVCLGGGTLHISFDGGNTYVSRPGDYHYASQSRLVAHNTYGACSRKWHDYDISDNTPYSLRNGGRRMTVQEKKPLDLLANTKLTMIDPSECSTWIEDRLIKNDLFEQQGRWSTIYVEGPLVSFHIEYRQSDWFDRKCDFQSLDAWMSTVSPKLQKTDWNGILGETKQKKFNLMGEQIKSDRYQLLRGKNDSDYEVDGPFGKSFAALELHNGGERIKKAFSSVIDSVFSNRIVDLVRTE